MSDCLPGLEPALSTREDAYVRAAVEWHFTMADPVDFATAMRRLDYALDAVGFSKRSEQ